MAAAVQETLPEDYLTRTKPRRILGDEYYEFHNNFQNEVNAIKMLLATTDARRTHACFKENYNRWTDNKERRSFNHKTFDVPGCGQHPSGSCQQTRCDGNSQSLVPTLLRHPKATHR